MLVVGKLWLNRAGFLDQDYPVLRVNGKKQVSVVSVAFGTDSVMGQGT